MSKIIAKHIIRFIVIMFLQLMIFNYINLFGYINPVVFIYFILLLPFETPTWLYLILAFFTGITQDAFLNTGGIHAAAMTLIAFIRPILLHLISSRREFESGIKPEVQYLGWKWFLTYSGISILFYALITEFLLVFRLSNIGQTFLRVFWQALFTYIFVIIFEFIRSLNKKKITT